MKHLALIILFALVGISASQAQLGLPGGSGISASMTKLFADFKGFSSKVEMRTSENGKQTMQINVGYIVLDGKLRMEMDIAAMKSDQMPAEARTMLRNMGMDKITTLVLPEPKRMMVMYPNIQAVVDMPMPPEEAVASATKYDIDKKAIGSEKVNNYSCTKNKVTLTSPKGERSEAITWNAKELKDFPVKTEFTVEGVTVTMVFTDIKLELPSATLFEVPENYEKAANENALYKIATKKMAERAKAK